MGVNIKFKNNKIGPLLPYNVKVTNTKGEEIDGITDITIRAKLENYVSADIGVIVDSIEGLEELKERVNVTQVDNQRQPPEIKTVVYFLFGALKYERLGDISQVSIFRKTLYYRIGNSKRLLWWSYGN